MNFLSYFKNSVKLAIEAIKDKMFFVFIFDKQKEIRWIEIALNREATNREVLLLRKYTGTYIYCQGERYRIDQWGLMVEKALKLKKRDLVWNPYKQTFTYVDEVQFTWSTIYITESEKYIRYICEVIIIDNLGDLIYSI